jgi:hypothetical protein
LHWSPAGSAVAVPVLTGRLKSAYRGAAAASRRSFSGQALGDNTVDAQVTVPAVPRRMERQR